MTVIADTGALYALVDRSDAWHDRVVQWWEQTRDAVLVPYVVLPELAYLLHHRIGPRAERAFVDAVASGEFEVEFADSDDIARAAKVMQAYPDTPLGFVDASVVVIAERLDVTTLLTTDRRHFSLVRPRHVSTFQLVP